MKLKKFKKTNVPNFVTNSKNELFFDMTEFMVIKEKYKDSEQTKTKEESIKDMYNLALGFGAKQREDGGIHYTGNLYLFPDGTMKMLTR